MKKIGVLFGMENSFPGAVVERINSLGVDGIAAEFVQIGGVHMDRLPAYSVILDRVSHDVPFYRAFLKHAALSGSFVINNPFWCSADDKFFNYSLAARLGVATPPTVILPHKDLPPGTTDRSMRNLEYPLNWDAVFGYVGFPGFLKPIDGGGWRDVHYVRNREEFFRHYDQSRDLCMMFQRAVNFSSYFRCYVVGQQKVRAIAYDPHRPHAERYVLDARPPERKLLRQIEKDALTLCRALGYDLNTVEFAVEDGIPYAIDFMNPAPEVDLPSIGAENFEWVVREVAALAVRKAKLAPRVPELRWAAFLGAETERSVKPAKKKPAARKAAKKKAPGKSAVAR